jgi:hypothetical protein
MPIKISYIKHNINQINSLQMYDTAQNYKVLHRLDKRLAQNSLKISNHGHIHKVRQKTMIQIKLVGKSIIFHWIKLNLSNKCNDSWVVSIK